MEEKSLMQQEINKLQVDLEKYENPTTISDDGTSLGPIQLGSSRYNELRKQLESLKDELLQAETAKDDYKMKSHQQEKEILNLQSKLEELHQTTSELSNLKDEIDALREASDKMKVLEAQLAVYKKKLEDHNDLKKQVKMLEERSAEYLSQNLQFEGDIKRYTEMKGQVDLYKKEIKDLHEKLDTEMSKTIKIEFELSNMDAKLTAIQRERDNLLSERDMLRETCDELRCNNQGSGTDVDNTMSRELLPTGLKDKLERLEAENKALREGQGGQTALAQLLDDSNQRIEKLREQLKGANQKILVLTQTQNDDSSKGDLVVQLRQSLELNDQKSSQIDDLQTQMIAMQSKAAQQESELSAKEQELTASDVRYRKCVEKAKEVIKNLDPRAATEATLMDKPLDTGEESRQGMGPVEERLITSAFYRLGLSLQRDTVDSRLALLSGPGQSFLARQRQPPPRKPIVGQKAK